MLTERDKQNLKQLYSEYRGRDKDVVREKYLDANKNMAAARRELGNTVRKPLKIRTTSLSSSTSCSTPSPPLPSSPASPSDSSANCKRLSSEFRRPSGNCSTQLRDHWIEHLYSIHKNYDATRKALQDDEKLRNDIQKLHVLRNASPENSRAYNQYGKGINELVRKRNLPLNQLNNLNPSQLIFDLHWFTKTGAIEFVHNLCEAMWKSKKRLEDSDEVVTLITGRGLHSFDSTSAIQEELMDEYDRRIEKDENNAGVVYLFFHRRI